MTSCDPSDARVPAEALSVSVKNPKVSSDRGTQFVDVKCSGNWTLTLVEDDAQPEWATLSAYSGTGNKSNVRLEWKTNSTEVDRTLTIVLDNGSKSAHSKAN